MMADEPRPGVGIRARDVTSKTRIHRDGFPNLFQIEIRTDRGYFSEIAYSPEWLSTADYELIDIQEFDMEAAVRESQRRITEWKQITQKSFETYLNSTEYSEEEEENEIETAMYTNPFLSKHGGFGLDPR